MLDHFFAQVACRHIGPIWLELDCIEEPLQHNIDVWEPLLSVAFIGYACREADMIPPHGAHHTYVVLLEVAQDEVTESHPLCPGGCLDRVIHLDEEVPVAPRKAGPLGRASLCLDGGVTPKDVGCGLWPKVLFIKRNRYRTPVIGFP